MGKGGQSSPHACIVKGNQAGAAVTKGKKNEQQCGRRCGPIGGVNGRNSQEAGGEANQWAERTSGEM